jgi:hypothetical protein
MDPPQPPPRRAARFKLKRGELRPEDVPPPPNSPKKTRRKKTNVGWLPKIREETEHNLEDEATSSNINSPNSNNEGPRELVEFPEYRPRPRPELRPPSARALTLQTRRREAAIQASLEEHTRRRNRYFKNGHILSLAGHADAKSPDTYRLKPNEFYTTPTVCGYVGYTYKSDDFDFITSRPQIRIPTSSNTSFFNTNTKNYFYQKRSQQQNVSGKIYKEYGAYKMYAPFSPASGSHTIHNTNVMPCAYWEIKEFTIPTPHEFTLNYNGHTKTYDKYPDTSNFNIYKISVSGVLKSHNGHSKVETYLQRPDLLEVSKQIVAHFSIPRIEVHHDYYFYIFVPHKLLNLKILHELHLDNPLITYTRDAIISMYQDSVLSLEELYGADVTLNDLLTKTLPLSTLYPQIHAKLDDQSAPMLLINNLCREHTPYAEYIINSNSNVEPRGYDLRFLRTTQRGQRIAKRGKSILHHTIRNTVPQYMAFKRIAPPQQHEIMKLYVQRKHITHEKYSRSPEATIKFLALSSGFTQKLWRTFLVSLDKSEFATP